MWNPFKSRAPEPVADDEPEQRSSLFSTHDTPTPNRPGFDLAGRLNAFAEIRPRATLTPGAEAVAMDSADNAASDISLVKGYSRGQPNVSDAVMGWYAAQSFIGHQLAALIAQHWLVQKACAMPAKDAVRNGFTITTVDGDDLPKETDMRLRRLDKRYALTKNLKEWVTFGRIFGIRICMFKVDYDDPVAAYEAPFNIDGVKPGAYKGMVQIDPYWCSPMLDAAASAQPNDMHFYEPTWWLINGQRYHRTHLVIYRNGNLADILKPAYLYGGIPVPQLIMERVYASERTANEAPLLALTKRTTVYKTDVAKAVANYDMFASKIQRWSELWNNNGIRVIGTDDEVDQKDTALADLDALIMTQYQLVAAAAEVPGTKLLGTAPKGFNATGEFDESSYHENLEGIQTDMTLLIERHHMLCIKSGGLPEVSTSVTWEALDSPTAKEMADTNLVKAQAGAALVASGAIDGMDERNRIAGDKYSGYPAVEPVADDAAI